MEQQLLAMAQQMERLQAMAQHLERFRDGQQQSGQGACNPRLSSLQLDLTASFRCVNSSEAHNKKRS